MVLVVDVVAFIKKRGIYRFYFRKNFNERRQLLVLVVVDVVAYIDIRDSLILMKLIKQDNYLLLKLLLR